MDKSGQDIQDKAFSLAKEYELENGNCAQSTLCGVLEALGMENNDVFRSATGLADGVGLTGEGHCGALSGGAMAIGCIFGRKREDFKRQGKMLKAVILSRQLVNRFKEKYGTCSCRELQTKFFGGFLDLLDQSNFEEAQKRGMPETCSNLAGEVARLTAQIILEQQEKEAAKSQ